MKNKKKQLPTVSKFLTLLLASGLFAQLAVKRFLNGNIYFVPRADLRNNTFVNLILTGFPSLKDVHAIRCFRGKDECMTYD